MAPGSIDAVSDLQYNRPDQFQLASAYTSSKYKHLHLLKPFTESHQGPAEQLTVSVAASSRPLSLLVPMADKPGLPAILLDQLAPPVQPCQLRLDAAHQAHETKILIIIHVKRQQCVLGMVNQS